MIKGVYQHTQCKEHFFKVKIYFYFIYMSHFAYMTVYHVWAWYLQRPEEDLRSPRTGVQVGF